MSEITLKSKKKKKKKVPLQTKLPQNNKIVDIESYIDEHNNPTMTSSGYFQLKYYMDKTSFSNDQEYTRFVKAVERMVRTSEHYKEYINILKTHYGLNYCMLLGNITDDEDVSIEMHHGPLMTLYDVVALITNAAIAHNQPISTFTVTETVLQEHFKHHVQVTMLCKTAHQAVHSNKIFLHPSQAIGDIATLLHTYKDGIDRELALGIDTYLKLAETHEHTQDSEKLLNLYSMKNWSTQKDEILELIV